MQMCSHDMCPYIERGVRGREGKRGREKEKEHRKKKKQETLFRELGYLSHETLG